MNRVYVDGSYSWNYPSSDGVSYGLKKDGKEITNIHPSKRGMGIVFQNYALFENMTVLRNVEYALRLDKTKKNEVYR